MGGARRRSSDTARCDALQLHARHPLYARSHSRNSLRPLSPPRPPIPRPPRPPIPYPPCLRTPHPPRPHRTLRRRKPVGVAATAAARARARRGVRVSRVSGLRRPPLCTRSAMARAGKWRRYLPRPPQSPGYYVASSSHPPHSQSNTSHYMYRAQDALRLFNLQCATRSSTWLSSVHTGITFSFGISRRDPWNFLASGYLSRCLYHSLFTASDTPPHLSFLLFGVFPQRIPRRGRRWGKGNWRTWARTVLQCVLKNL
ncbi:hypothetical protein B0H16DRAFT_1569694 [Mycena metata]|uniref:Uncharacterized protein n=1 Tax=Mycena metata TaxID=1033252 RepID=A0AAD7N0G1_9AGAR|nr:hypothetical protein B0H16DRAFT_1569694 [Mycena metata]